MWFSAVRKRMAAGSAVALFVICSPVRSQPQVTVEKVLDEWQRRQDRVDSAAITWDEEVSVPKGVTSFLLNQAGVGKRSGTIGKTYPPYDFTYVLPRYVSFDRDKLRYEYKEQDLRERQDERHHVFTFDGRQGKILNEKSGTYSQGSIREERRHTEISNLHIRPLLMLYRAMHPAMSPIRNARYQLSGRTATVGGRVCIELVAVAPGRARNQIWVDPTRGFLPMRYVVSLDAVDLGKVDVEYRADPTAEWVPISWTLISRHTDGTLLSSSRAKVTASNFNAQIPNSEFDPTFPVGTYVVDLSNKQHFIQKENGRVRKVLPAERARSYDELLNSEPPSSVTRRRWVTWMALGSGLVAATLFVAWIFRRSRADRAGDRN